MFDIAWSELALIGFVAVVVIGPKDLPKVMRTLGRWTRKARLLANEFQRNMDDMVRQSELDELRKQVQAVNAGNLRQEVEKMVDVQGIRDAIKVEPAASAAAAVPVEEATGAASAAQVPPPSPIPAPLKPEDFAGTQP